MIKKSIRVLDDKTINQIAAGEVIENTASCIKELIENAIDAQAKFIEVQFSAGGRKKMVVIDDGIGMNFDDALLSLERHATSKIKELKDMDQIQTMGFRGEALPSMASVSKFILETSDGTKATKVICHGGKLIDHHVSSRVQGTTVEIHSLFYNVPARQKFQKQVSIDTREVTKIVTQFALAYPEISFKLVQDQKEIFFLKSKKSFTFLENLHYRIEELYGKQLAKELTEVDIEKNGITLKGFISKASLHRPNRLQQHLFVNKRVIESKIVSLGVREGYSTRLPENRYPIFFLSMSLDPKVIDVNVHPQKKEIRFKESYYIKETITQIIDQALRSSRLPQVLRSPINKEVFFQKAFNTQDPKITHAENIVVIEEEKKELFIEPNLDFIPHIVGLYSKYILIDSSSLTSKMALEKEDEKGLMLIHQYRAKARILFETLLNRGQKLPIQNLLLPKTFEFSKADTKIMENLLPFFEELGISLRFLGKESFILDGLPSMIPMECAQDLIEMTLEDLKQNKVEKILKKEQKKLLAKSLCTSVRFSKIIDENEAKPLLEKLFRCENFEYSPLGKPIFVSLSNQELEKKFK